MMDMKEESRVKGAKKNKIFRVKKYPFSSKNIATTYIHK